MVKKIRKILRIYMIRKKHRVTFEYLKIFERRIKKQKNTGKIKIIRIGKYYFVSYRIILRTFYKKIPTHTKNYKIYGSYYDII